MRVIFFFAIGKTTVGDRAEPRSFFTFNIVAALWLPCGFSVAALWLICVYVRW
jgi:hypothetical protein